MIRKLLLLILLAVALSGCAVYGGPGPYGHYGGPGYYPTWTYYGGNGGHMSYRSCW